MSDGKKRVVTVKDLASNSKVPSVPEDSFASKKEAKKEESKKTESPRKPGE